MKNKLRFPDKTKVHRFRIVLTKVLFQFRASETHYNHQTAGIKPSGKHNHLTEGPPFTSPTFKSTQNLFSLEIALGKTNVPMGKDGS
jgi:hypothetical protein